MAKNHTIRFASGSPEAAFSIVWRMVARKNDVYLGASKLGMASIKFSLHESGVWVLAATSESQGVLSEDGNRREIGRAHV